jgi:hypothetical protein
MGIDMDMTELLLNGAGGAIIGPLIAQFLGGKHQSLLTRILAGIVGGLGAGAGAQQAGLSLPDLLNNPETTRMIQSVLEGGVGGGVLASLAGMLRKR